MFAYSYLSLPLVTMTTSASSLATPQIWGIQQLHNQEQHLNLAKTDAPIAKGNIAVYLFKPTQVTRDMQTVKSSYVCCFIVYFFVLQHVVVVVFVAVTASHTYAPYLVCCHHSLSEFLFLRQRRDVFENIRIL